MNDAITLAYHLFALFGILVVLIALVGVVISWVERYKEGFKYNAGDKVSTVYGSVLFNTLSWKHYVVISRFNNWWGRRNYLVTGPDYLEGTAPGNVYPVDIRRESELHKGWK